MYRVRVIVNQSVTNLVQPIVVPPRAPAHRTARIPANQPAQMSAASFLYR